MGGGDGGASWKLKKAAKKIFLLQTCGSFCKRQQTHVSPVSHDSRNYLSSSLENQKRSISCKNNISSEITVQANSSTCPSSNKTNLCAICLDPLNNTKAIFMAQCSHAFHFACITSNIQHGNVTCPICRAHWTQLPNNPTILLDDDSNIANSRIDHRRSFYPIEPDHSTSVRTHLSFSLLAHTSFNSCPSPNNNGVYLRVKLEHDQPATDLVLVAAPNGPIHLVLMKQAMALMVSSLRPIDRLAIVTCPSSAGGGTRVCTFRRMTSNGKSSALKIIDQLLFHTARVDPMEGLEKGAKVLEDRVHKNLESCILHLTDTSSTTRSYNHWFDSEVPVTIHRFNFGFGFGGCNYGSSLVHEFEGFLARTVLGGRVQDIQLRIGERKNNMVARIGELRSGEERNIPLCVGDQSGRVRVKYSYRDGGDGECIRTGDIVVGMEEDDKGDGTHSRYEYDVPIGTRMSSAGNWDYHDPFMARRWARYLHRL